VRRFAAKIAAESVPWLPPRQLHYDATASTCQIVILSRGSELVTLIEGEQLTRTLATIAAVGLSAATLAACGGGGDSATGAEALKSVRAQIATAQEEQAVCAEMINTERTNIEVAQELGRPTHNFELNLTTYEKCLEEERLKETSLRGREGELETPGEAVFNKCQDAALASERTCLKWREEAEASGE
jgi:hypothetical protein